MYKEIPKQIRYINHFLNSCESTIYCINLTAISHCYANYKVFHVLYSEDVMDIIYDFDNRFPLNDNEIRKVPVITNESNDEVQVEYYNPKNLKLSQSRVTFPFIKFVKASNNLFETQKEKKFELPENSISQNKITNLINFKEALQSDHCRKLETFGKIYANIKRNRNLKLSHENLLNKVGKITKTTAECVVTQVDQSQELYHCEIVLNKLILAGKNLYSSNKISAIDEAIDDFHTKLFHEFGIQNDFNETNFNCVPEVFNSEIVPPPQGFVLHDLPFLKNFFLRYTENDNPIAILQQSFQYFKMTMNFTEDCNQMHLFICGVILASIDMLKDQSVTKSHLSRYVLDNFHKSLWTVIRNRLCDDDSDQIANIEKKEMYETNLKDPSRIESQKNIGGQMMHKMGWSEDKGLGKVGNGIRDPIINEVICRRIGIGFHLGSSKDLKSFRNNVGQILRTWMESKDQDELMFNRHFDDKERAMIHKECRKLGLVSKSYNNENGSRFLVVSFSHSNPEDFLKWIQSKGGKTKFYTLFPPGTLNNLV